MENNEKSEFIRERLEQQKEPLPVSLEKENVVSMLKSVNQGERKKAKIIPIKKYASIAAAFVIAVTALIFGMKMNKPNDNITIDKEVLEEVTAPISYTDSENEYKGIEEYFLKMHEEEVEQHEKYADAADDENVAYNTMTAPTVKANFGETNIQTKGVDEGDIIKNDGKYIYIATKNLIRIVDAENMNVSAVITDFVSSDESKVIYTVRGIYVSNDTLTVVSTEYSPKNEYTVLDPGDDMIVYNSACMKYYSGGNENIVTCITSYDISDRTQPKKISERTQSGSYNSSRSVDGVIYTVSIYSVDVSYYKTDDEIKENCIPKVDGKPIPASEIFADGDDSRRSYVVISSFFIDGKGDGDAYAYLGNCDELYATEDTVYIFSNHNANDEKGRLYFYTEITSVSAKNGQIAPKAKGRVSGSMCDRFCADEYNGKLRIATTNSIKSEYTVSLYILDGNLEQVGAIENFRQDEQIKSVRYMGDTAYIVTFEVTDPLFVVDLSDPTAPKVIGKVELPGFSNYLHSVQDGYIVGVGYGGDEDGADENVVKIVLFDVTDPKNPKVADEILIENADPDVNYDPLSFLYDSERQLIFLPTVVYDSEFKSHCSLRVIEAKDGKLSEKFTFDHRFNKYDADSAELFRGTYISNTAYTITEKGVCAFDMNKNELSASLKF